MTSVRTRTLLIGVALAIVVGVLGALVGEEQRRLPLFAVALGAALALVPARNALLRAGAFLLGVVTAFLVIAVGLSITMSDFGMAITAAVLVLIVAGIAAATDDVLPMSALLLGVAAMVGAYEFLATNLFEFTAESLTAGSSMLLAAAIGFAITTVLGTLRAEADDASHNAAHPTPRVREDAPATSEIAR